MIPPKAKTSSADISKNKMSNLVSSLIPAYPHVRPMLYPLVHRVSSGPYPSVIHQ